jgi:predicted ribosomally synthesized peptide with SipW-like signal peptide
VQEFQVSRRQALGGLAAVGGASTGIGLGTAALFNDSEEFSENSVTAGELNLKVAWKKRVVQADERIEQSSDYPNPTNNVDAPICDLGDVKPGDRGHIEFVLLIDDNPGYLSLLGAEQADEENGQPEPERGVLTESIPPGREGELDELAETTLLYSDNGPTAYDTSLASLIDMGSVGTGIPLDGAGSASVTDIILGGVTPAPFEAGTKHHLRVEFAVPAAVGNGIQSDSYRFTIGFYGVQARNNEP